MASTFVEKFVSRVWSRKKKKKKGKEGGRVRGPIATAFLALFRKGQRQVVTDRGEQ